MANQSQQSTWKGKESSGSSEHESSSKGVQDGVSKLFGDAQGKVQEVAATVKEFAGNIVEKAKDGTEEVTGLIEQYPGRSLLIGLGVGIIMGVTFSAIMKRA